MAQADEPIDVSIIIPNYNSAKYLTVMIKSVQHFYTHYQYEILVIDDGSDVADQSVLNKLAGLTGVQIIMQKHRGVSCARNLGIRRARGRYLMFCDADDQLLGVLPPQNFTADIVSYSINCKKKRTVNSMHNKETLISSMFGFDRDQANFPAVYGGSVAKLFRRTFLLTNEVYFDSQLTNSEDLLFNTQAILAAKSIRVESRAVYLYKKRSSSVTHQFDSRLLDNHIYFINHLRKLLLDVGMQQLLSRIISLYLYQLVFRLFCFSSGYRRKYYEWCRAISYQRTAKWNDNLSRNVERITVSFINHFGITAAVIFAKVYLEVKKLIHPRDEQAVIL